MSTTTPDLMDRWARTMDQASQLAWDWWDQSQAMMEPWRDVVTGMATSPEPDDHHHHHGRHHDHDHDQNHDHDHRGGRDGCGCHDCDRHPGRQRGRGGQHPCGCEKRDARARSVEHHGLSCRHADADVVVRARAGERRVIPFVVRNSRRRERTVTLEVGPWHACSDELVLKTAFDTTSPLELGPCEERVVRLLVDIQVARRDVSVGLDREHAEAGLAEAEHAAAKEGTVDREAGEVVVTPRTWGGDVLCCATTYADVRFDGCARPVRVAIEVCPADCGAVDLTCSCGCC